MDYILHFLMFYLYSLPSICLLFCLLFMSYKFRQWQYDYFFQNKKEKNL